MVKFDLEERTTEYAITVVKLCRSIPHDAVNDRLIRQVVSSSGSVGANYREANDSVGYKDFVFRLKISRKEAKESIHWLILIKASNPLKSLEIDNIISEATEIKNILSSMINKATINKK